MQWIGWLVFVAFLAFCVCALLHIKAECDAMAARLDKIERRLKRA